MKPLYIIVLFFGVTLSVTAQDSTQYSAYELLSSYYDNDFKPFTPKKWFVGLSFSLSDQTQENTASLLSKTLKAESNSFSITAKVGRFVGDYFLVGGNFELSQERYDGQIISDNDTISRQSLKRQYGVIPTIRTYFPLVKNERFSFFNDINVGFKYGTELIRDTKNLDEIEKAYNQNFTFQIGLSPGITFFAMQNFAFEVQLDVLTYKLEHTKNKNNEDDPSREITNDVNLSIDLLSLDLGLAYYFGAKRNSK